MKPWTDARLSPKRADWPDRHHAVTAVHVTAPGLLRASGQEVVDAARDARSVVVTKDCDFVELPERRSPPPHVIWIACGKVGAGRTGAIIFRWRALRGRDGIALPPSGAWGILNAQGGH